MEFEAGGSSPQQDLYGPRHYGFDRIVKSQSHAVTSHAGLLPKETPCGARFSVIFGTVSWKSVALVCIDRSKNQDEKSRLKAGKGKNRTKKPTMRIPARNLQRTPYGMNASGSKTLAYTKPPS
jgi:hypothetical protein